MVGQEITDPSILAQLNGGNSQVSSLSLANPVGAEITDPHILSQLNSQSALQNQSPSLLSSLGAANTLGSGYIINALKSVGAGIGQGAQSTLGMARNIGSQLPLSSMGINVNQLNPGLSNYINQLGQSAQNYPIAQKMGIPNIQPFRDIATISQFAPVGGAMGKLISPLLSGIERTPLGAALSSNPVKNFQEFGENAKTEIPQLYQQESDNLFGKGNTAADAISKQYSTIASDKSQTYKNISNGFGGTLVGQPTQITKPLTIGGIQYDPEHLQIMKEIDPEFYRSILPDINKNEGLTSTSPYDLYSPKAQKEFSTNSLVSDEYNKYIENPTYDNAQALKIKLNTIAGKIKDPSLIGQEQRAFYSGAAMNLKNNQIIPSMVAHDAANGTTFADQYQKAENLHGIQQGFLSDPLLEDVSRGVNTVADNSDIANAIVKAQNTASPFNPNNPAIDSDHPLSTLLPWIQNLAQYKATPKLANIAEGRSTLDPNGVTKAIQDAQENGLIPNDHAVVQQYGTPLQTKAMQASIAANKRSIAQTVAGFPGRALRGTINWLSK